MNIKPIKTEAEYEEALVTLERLMDAEPGSIEEEQLECLSKFIEEYEDEHYFIDMPDAISAIKFRMEQMGLKQKDLVPYIGSQPKVSAVLRGDRELSKTMIRKLHVGLGIPYDVLMQEHGAEYKEQKYRIEDFPFNDMVRKGLFPGFTNVRNAKILGEELLEQLFSVFSDQEPELTYCRHGNQVIDPKALLAWQAYVLSLIGEGRLPEYSRKSLDDEFFAKLLDFSNYDEGIKLVKEHLNKYGVHYVVARHLEHTYLDGASFLTPDGAPVVAMTLRHDRLDNFWFTLFHELAHVVLHLGKNSQTAFFDDVERERSEEDSPAEREANQFAQEKMIPNGFWVTHCQPRLGQISEWDIHNWASELNISKAIIAGRVRYESHNFQHLTTLIGTRQVRKHFPEYRQAR
jgi:HTH-type transcriptional regulator/antitoxin HigA